MSKKKFLHEAEFKQLKYATDTIPSNKKVAAIFQRSVATISKIRRSADFQGYQAKIRADITRSRENVAKRQARLDEETKAHNEIVPVMEKQPATDMATLISELQKINTNLDRLVLAWEAKPR